MIVDTSALLAIFLRESDAQRFERAIEGAERPLMSAANFVEAGFVAVARAGSDARFDLEDFVHDGGIEVLAVTLEQARIAVGAFARFGRGRGHPANLNLGDCFAYALAKSTGEPLLYKGNDFSHTDIASA
jgi:ribonuclease VapC